MEAIGFNKVFFFAVNVCVFFLFNYDSILTGHEESGGSGGGDPAVLAVGPSRRPLTYTRDQLMRLRHSPLVKQGLENAFAGNDHLALYVTLFLIQISISYLKRDTNLCCLSAC